MTEIARHPNGDFAPGNVGGPGQHPVPVELAMARRLNTLEVSRMLNGYMWRKLDDLVDIANQEDVVVVEKILIQIIMKAIMKGDEICMDWILKRIDMGLPMRRRIIIPGFTTRNKTEDEQTVFEMLKDKTARRGLQLLAESSVTKLIESDAEQDEPADG